MTKLFKEFKYVSPMETYNSIEKIKLHRDVGLLAVRNRNVYVLTVALLAIMSELNKKTLTMNISDIPSLGKVNFSKNNLKGIKGFIDKYNSVMADSIEVATITENDRELNFTEHKTITIFDPIIVDNHTFTVNLRAEAEYLINSLDTFSFKKERLYRNHFSQVKLFILLLALHDEITKESIMVKPINLIKLSAIPLNSTISRLNQLTILPALEELENINQVVYVGSYQGGNSGRKTVFYELADSMDHFRN